MAESRLTWLSRLGDTARLMVGVPGYEQYLLHMREHHPDVLPMSRDEFFRNRLEARYGGKGIKKCPC